MSFLFAGTCAWTLHHDKMRRRLSLVCRQFGSSISGVTINIHTFIIRVRLFAPPYIRQTWHAIICHNLQGQWQVHVNQRGRWFQQCGQIVASRCWQRATMIRVHAFLSDVGWQTPGKTCHSTIANGRSTNPSIKQHLSIKRADD